MEYELIVSIVNSGFASQAMDAARACGAKGGTILHARGTAREEAEKKFNIAIHPEKEMVLIVVKKEIADDILKALYNEVGLKTPGQGIAFTIPIDETAGLEGKKQEKIENLTENPQN